MGNKCYLCFYAKTIVEREEDGHKKFFIRCFRDTESRLREPCDACDRFTEDEDADDEAREFFFTHFTEGGVTR